MYLTDTLIVNNGELVELVLTPAFNSDGAPKPLLFVGSNGSGKTTVLSIIADGLIEHAKQSFRDVIQPDPYGRRLYFRLVGGSTLRMGASFSASFLRFEQNGSPSVSEKPRARSDCPL